MHRQPVTLTAQALLMAVGRKPDIADLALENAAIMHNPKGIAVNATLQTTAKNVYACGDVVGPYQFSHMAEIRQSLPFAMLCCPSNKELTIPIALFGLLLAIQNLPQRD